MKKSFYAALAPEHRAELDRRLITSGFADYNDHLQWLKSIGCNISKAVLAQYGDKYRAKLEAIKLQHDYRLAYGVELSDDIEMNATNLIATAQRATQYLLDVVELKMKEVSESEAVSALELAQAANTLSKVIGAVSAINSSQVVQQKMVESMREKQEARLNAMDGEDREGITQAFLDDIRTNILRI